MPDETRSQAGAELSAVIASYLEAVDEGRVPDPDDLLARHPHLGPELRSFLAAERGLAVVAGSLRSRGGPETVSVAPDRTQDDSPVRQSPCGTYVLRELIGVGGMGAVYRATDTLLNREVAVKVLQERFGPGSGAARRFADEANITAQLQHPGIPPVHDLGTLPDGRPFLAMKLIRGSTLDDLLRERLNPGTDRGRFVAAFEQVAQAVGYAHSRGVVHRDLKPGNVMVGAFGEVQVMDWGLAKPGVKSQEDRGGRMPRASYPRRGAGRERPRRHSSGVSSERRRTWLPSKPRVRSTRSMPAATCSGWAGSFARF